MLRRMLSKTRLSWDLTDTLMLASSWRNSFGSSWILIPRNQGPSPSIFPLVGEVPLHVALRELSVVIMIMMWLNYTISRSTHPNISFLLEDNRLILTTALLLRRASATTSLVTFILGIALVLPPIVGSRFTLHILPIHTLLLEVFVRVII